MDKHFACSPAFPCFTQGFVWLSDPLCMDHQATRLIIHLKRVRENKQLWKSDQHLNAP